jgi:hypothetical protein
MGQLIEIDQVVQLGDVLLISTDRSLSGQDGETYRINSDVGANPTFPAKLSLRLFEADPKIEHVYVMSNTVSIGRTGGWDDPAIESARQVVANFFTFYKEA